MGFMVERSANGATENKLYTQSYEIFGVIWGAIVSTSFPGPFPLPQLYP